MYPRFLLHSAIAKLFVILLLLTSSFILAHAQGGVGSTRGLPETVGGSNIVQGHVYFPEGQMAGKRVKVTLESADELTKSTLTDDDGTFRFNGLRSGSYTIVVEGGREYEPAREQVFFEGANRNTMVPIYLRSKIENLPEFANVPKAAIDSYRKAEESVQKGDSKKAVEFLKAALVQAPTFTPALNELGLQYMRLNQMDKAAETYEALLKISTSDARGHLNLGIALYNLSLANLAEKKTDEANQKLGEAEQHLRQALLLKSPGPNAHYYLGLTLIRLRKYGEAQSEMETAIANGGDSLAQAHKYLGGLYMSAKRNKDAADQLEKYLQLDPKAKDAEQIRGTIKDLRSKQ